MKRACRMRSTDDGAAAVEFAIVLPLLLLVIFAVIDFGRAFNTQITLTQAAREGVRLQSFGSPTITSSDVEQRVHDAATPMDPGTLSVSSSGVPCTPGDPTQVQVTNDFSFVTPIGAIASMFGGGGGALSGTITLMGLGDMRCGG